jgi:cytochrome bd-type quinol oxidase subunit 2
LIFYRPLWCALALTMLLYVLLDGFDLGLGILFDFTRDEQERRRMPAAISPVWDGYETWLVLTASLLFGSFPRVYATLFSAFYLPMIFLSGSRIVMLCEKSGLTLAEGKDPLAEPHRLILQTRLVTFCP